MLMKFSRDEYCYTQLRTTRMEDSTSDDTDNFFVKEKLLDNVKFRQLQTRILVAVIIVFIVTTITLSVVLTVRAHKDEEKMCSTDPPGAPRLENGTEGVCLTPGCVLAAARVLSAMDQTVKPCDDFFNFACGTWIRQHVIPEDKSSYGTFTKVRDDVSVILKSVFEAENKDSDPGVVAKARNYYKACNDLDSIEKKGLAFIQEYMEKFGGWPVLGSGPGGKRQPANFSLEDLLINARKGTNYIPLIDVGVTTDEKNPDHRVLYIDQPDLGMPSRDYYLKGRNDTTLMAYETLIVDSAVAFGADHVTAGQDAKDVVDMEIELANITVRKEDRRDAEKLYNKMTLGQLSSNFSGVDWKKLIQGILHHINVGLDDSETVIAIAPPFLAKIGIVLKKYPPRVLQNYVVARRVIGKSFYLPQVFRDISQKYKKVLTGTASQPARWESCVNNVKDSLPEVVGRLFVDEAFKGGAKADVLDLVGKLRTAFKEMIDDLDWMESKTKQTAKEKADYIVPRIGYADIVYNDTALNEKYANLKVYSDDPLRTFVSDGEAAVIRTLENLRKPVDKTEWDISPATVNAYYNPETNQITFPAAILQPPFYTHDQPGYLNYGGIGYVIGHEITHGFDDQGRQFDKEGNLQDWWSDTDAAKFKARAQCIIDQYSNFTVPGTGGMTLNGINTQGENIADNGGIKEAYKAYQKWVEVSRHGKQEDKLPGLDYTPDQLYFLNAAQIWCENMRDAEKIESIRTDPHSLYMYRFGVKSTESSIRLWSSTHTDIVCPHSECMVLCRTLRNSPRPGTVQLVPS